LLRGPPPSRRPAVGAPPARGHAPPQRGHVPAVHGRGPPLQEHSPRLRQVHPAAEQHAGAARLPLVVQQELLESLGRPLEYEHIASYKAVVLVPHVPNNAAFADLYAMQAVFGGPALFAVGTTAMQSRAPAGLRPAAPAWWLEEGANVSAQYPPFAHLTAGFPSEPCGGGFCCTRPTGSSTRTTVRCLGRGASAASPSWWCCWQGFPRRKQTAPAAR
ncbi:unnamed protein product, partial [Prorocentrum cordatum]